MYAVDLLFMGQYKHLETGEHREVPASHWARALEAMRPQLSPPLERAMFHAMLLYQRTMRALEAERQDILQAHRAAAPGDVGAAMELQSRLDALLRRFRATNTLHNLFAVYSMSPRQWASLFVGAYPYVPSVYVELWGEALRRYMLRVADGK
jgi:hypothetical protein